MLRKRFSARHPGEAPVQFSFAAASSSQGSNGNAGGVVIFDFGTIGSGSNVTATVIATSLAPGVFTNSVTVLGVEGDPNPANNSVVEPTTVTTVAGGGGGSGIVVVPNTSATALASRSRRAQVTDQFAPFRWGERPTSAVLLRRTDTREPARQRPRPSKLTHY